MKARGKLRRECLVRELLYSLREAWLVIVVWKQKYNELRSLRMKATEEFAKEWASGERWRAQQASCLHSGSLLTSGQERLSTHAYLLTLSGP